MNRLLKSPHLRLRKTLATMKPTKALPQFWPEIKPLQTASSQISSSNKSFPLFSDADVSELFLVPPLKPEINASIKRFYNKKPKKSNQCNQPVKCRIVSKTNGKITVDCSPIDPNVRKEQQRIAEERRGALMETEKKTGDEAAKKALKEAEKLKVTGGGGAAENKESCPPVKVDESKVKCPKRLQGCQTEAENASPKTVETCQQECVQKSEVGKEKCLKEKGKKGENCEKENFNV